MDVGDEINVEITGTCDNHGITLYEGELIYIPEAKEGDYIRIRITKIDNTIIYGEHIKDLERPYNYEDEEDDDDDSHDYPPEVMEQYPQ